MSRIFTLLTMLIVVIFAVSNRIPIEVSLWPLPYDVQLPLVFIILSVFFIGFFIGSITKWIGYLFHKKETL